MDSVGGRIAGCSDTLFDSDEFTQLRADRAITRDVLRRERARRHSAESLGEALFALFAGAEHTGFFLVQAKPYGNEVGKSILRCTFGLRGRVVALGSMGLVLFDVRPW